MSKVGERLMLVIFLVQGVGKDEYQKDCFMPVGRFLRGIKRIHRCRGYGRGLPNTGRICRLSESFLKGACSDRIEDHLVPLSLEAV